MGDVVDFPADEMRRTQLFRAWAAAKEAGHHDADAIWAEYLSTFVAPESRVLSKQIYSEVSK
jgi:hypothetical protein